MYLLDSQSLLVESGFDVDSAYKISVGVESLAPRMTRIIALHTTSILDRFDFLALP
jgi:Fe-S cluster assembly ATPase SufC